MLRHVSEDYVERAQLGIVNALWVLKATRQIYVRCIWRGQGRAAGMAEDHMVCLDLL